jgi:hypothetical protein
MISSIYLDLSKECIIQDENVISFQYVPFATPFCHSEPRPCGVRNLAEALRQASQCLRRDGGTGRILRAFDVTWKSWSSMQRSE